MNENNSFLLSSENDDTSLNYTESSYSNEKKKRKGKQGKQFSEVWQHIKRGKEVSSGSYEGTCSYCNEFWNIARPTKLRSHLAVECKKCPEEITTKFVNLILNEENNENKNKKIKVESLQTTLNFEKSKISEAKSKEIDNVLVKAFVCCNLAFSIIENPFFIELIKTLCNGYNIPTRRRLATELLERETIRVNLKVEKILQDSSNLTLAIDGWTSLTGRSYWNFVILTSMRQEYLYKICDLTEEKHTGQLLAEEILKVISSIGTNKFVAIITDNGSNVTLARKLITNQFPKIFNIRCVAHCVNLISHDFLKHNFAEQTLKYCNILVKFFKNSHKCNDLLEKLIMKYQITGGGLKTYVKTRWISVAECVNSVLRLKRCFNEVSIIS